MKFAETRLAGAYVIDPVPQEDDRGFFARSFCAREFQERGLNPNVAQCSISSSRRRGTVRGMHFQTPPDCEVKLVRCTRGAIYDVIVDLRAESPTYRSHVAVELTAGNRRALYVPDRFAHGFQTIEDETEVLYQMSEFYAPQSAAGLRYDDPVLSIRWPLEVSIISDRDRSWPLLTGPGS